GVLQPLAAQIDPLRLGEIDRAVNVAFEYGIRLCNDRRRVLRLIRNYPSHSFVIDYEEAYDWFGNVREPTSTEKAFEYALRIMLQQKTDRECVRFPAPEVIVACLNPQGEDTSEVTGEELT